MPPKKIKQQVLSDFAATIEAKPNLTKQEIYQKFPEFGGDDNVLQAAVDYQATSKSGKYSNLAELNSKFPEFEFEVEKKNPSQTTGGNSGIGVSPTKSQSGGGNQPPRMFGMDTMPKEANRTDNTGNGNRPLIAQTAADKKETEKLIEQKNINTQEALTRTVQHSLKTKGSKAAIGSPEYNQELEKYAGKLVEGEAVLGFDEEGKPGLKRTPRFIESVKTSFNDAVSSAKEADGFVNGMDAKQRVEYVKKQQAANPNPEYIGTSPTTESQLGELVGGSAPFLAKAGAGAAVGGLLVAGTPITGGGSLAGLPVALAFAATMPEMKDRRVQEGIMRRYEDNLKQHPDWTEEQAMEEADNAKWAAAGAALVENAALMVGMKAPVSFQGKTAFGKLLSGTAVSAGTMGSAAAATTAAELGIAKATGENISGEEIVEKSFEAGKEGFTTGGMLHLVTTGGRALPKLLYSGAKYALVKSKPNPQEIMAVLKENEAAGAIPEGKAEEVMKDLSDYKTALDQVQDGKMKPEVEASVAGLQQKINGLVEKKTTDIEQRRKQELDEVIQTTPIEVVDESGKVVHTTDKKKAINDKYDAEQKSVDAEIADTNAQIDAIKKSEKPLEHEVEEVSGKTYSELEKDNLKKRKQELEFLLASDAQSKETTGSGNLKGKAEAEAELKSINEKLGESAKTPTPIEQPTVSESLKDVESTATAIESILPDFNKSYTENGPSKEWRSFLDLIPDINRISKRVSERTGDGAVPFKTIISEAYHEAKADGSNPELVKAVEESLGKSEPTKTPTTPPTISESKSESLGDGGLVGKVEPLPNYGKTVSTKMGDVDLVVEPNTKSDNKNSIEVTAYNSDGNVLGISSAVIDAAEKTLTIKVSQVKEKYQRKGVYSKIVDEYESIAKERGLKLIAEPSGQTKDSKAFWETRNPTETKTENENKTNNKISEDEGRGMADVGSEITNDKSTRETAKPTELKQGEEVKLPSQIKGGLERTMIFDKGEWKQKVGDQISRVSEKAQQEAQGVFDAKNEQPLQKENVTAEKQSTDADVSKPMKTISADKINVSDFANTLRGRSTTNVDFGNRPIVGKNGTKLLSYIWEHNELIPAVRKDGGLVKKAVRVSDWAKSGVNANTGRNIVHKFLIETADGNKMEVSADSLAKALGYSNAEMSAKFPQVKDIVKRMASLQLEEQSLLVDIGNIHQQKAEIVKELEKEFGEKIEVYKSGDRHNLTETVWGDPIMTAEDSPIRTRFKEELRKREIWQAEIREDVERLRSVRNQLKNKQSQLDQLLPEETKQATKTPSPEPTKTPPNETEKIIAEDTKPAEKTKPVDAEPNKDSGSTTPPKEPKGEAVVEPEGEAIGLAHADTEAKAKEFGLEDRKKSATKTDDEVNIEADEIIKSGGIEDVLNKVENKLALPSAAEHVAMVKHAAEINKRVADAVAKGDSEAANKAMAEYDRVRKISDQAGSDQGLDFRARQLKVVDDNSLARFMSDRKADAKVDTLTPEQMKKAEADYNDLKTAKEAAEQKATEIEEAFEKYKAEQELQNAKRNGAKKSVGARLKTTHEERVKERAEIWERAKEKLAKLKESKTVKLDGNDVKISESSMMPPVVQKIIAVRSEIMEMFNSLAGEAGQTVETIVDAIHETVKEGIEGITKRDIRKAIAGEYNEKKATKNELAKQRRDLVEETKLLEAIEKIENGEPFPKTEKEAIARNQRLTDLRSKLGTLKLEKSGDEKFSDKIRKLEEELERVTFRKSKEKPAKGSAAEKEYFGREKELRDQIAEQKEKWDAEKDQARQTARDTRKLEAERDRQLKRVGELKEKLATLEKGQLPKAAEKGEAKKDTPEIEALKAEIKVAEKQVRETIAHDNRMEDLEVELQRIKERKAKEPKEESKREISQQEKDKRAEIEAEQKAWDVEKNIEKLNEELQRVKDRKAKVTDPKAKRELTATEADLVKEINDEKKVWAKEIEPERKVREAMKSTQKSLEDYEKRLAEKNADKKATDATPETPELKALRAKRDVAKKNYDNWLKEKKLGQYSEQNKFVSTAKTRITANNKIVEKISAKIKAGDFAEEAKPNSVLDNRDFQSANRKLFNEYVQSQVAVDNIRLDYERARIAEQEKMLSKGGKLAKALDYAATTWVSVMATFDQSIMMVQNLPFTMSHSVEAVKNFKEAVTKNIHTADNFNAKMAKLHGGAFWKMMEETGLAMYEPRSAKAELRNELHGGERNLLNKSFEVNGKKYSVGQAIERANSTLLNNARQKLFMDQVINLYEKGFTIESDLKRFENAARVANELTGHGKSAKFFQDNAKIWNKIIWSVKMGSSTFNLIGLGDIIRPQGIYDAVTGNKNATAPKGFYSGLDGQSRRHVAKEMGRFVGMGLLAGLVIKAAYGDDVEIDYDPLSVTFGTVKWKETGTTWQPFGRFTSKIKTLAIIMMATRHMNGKVDELGDKYGDKTTEDIALKGLFRSAMRPDAALMYDLKFNNGKDYFTGEKITPAYLAKKSIPMSLGGMSDDFNRDGALVGSVKTFGKFVGMSIGNENDFKNKFEEVKEQNRMGTYSEEDLKKPEYKFLSDKKVKRPIVQELGAYDVPKDSKHPEGKMTEDEYTKFVKLREDYVTGQVKKMMNASNYPIKDAEGEFVEVEGKKLTTEQVANELKRFTSKATNHAKKELGLVKESDEDDEEENRELKRARKDFDEN